MTVEIPRDRWGKPLIIPPDGGKPIPYMRASSFGDVLEDRSNLERWKMKKAVQGVAKRPDLYLKATVTPDDNRSVWKELLDAAMEAAGASSAASVGTSLHSLTEMLDRGEELPDYPPEYEADVAAYREATAGFRMDHIEQFMVCDELQIAGTPDRIMAGIIGDLKTGGSDSRYLDKHCVQLAAYAHSEMYDPSTGERTPVPNLNQETGVIFHLPAGKGTCSLYSLDLVAGWEGLQLAASVRAWRKKKGLLSSYAA